MLETTRLTQDKIENLNSYITGNDIESVVLKLRTKKILGQDGFTSEFY